MDSSIEAYLATVQAGEADKGILAMLAEADPVVQFVMFVIAVMSITCWAIILQKAIRLRAATRQSTSFLDLFWGSKRLDNVYEDCDKYAASPLAEVFKAGYQELAKANERGGNREHAAENLARTLRRATAVETTGLERYVTFLATTGSTAPFIGLFGTVWGILRAFQHIGESGNATIQTVGPDISEALIVTAMGLAAAIPAVMAFNFFSQRIRVLSTEMENFSADFLNIVKRHLG